MIDLARQARAAGYSNKWGLAGNLYLQAAEELRLRLPSTIGLYATESPEVQLYYEVKALYLKAEEAFKTAARHARHDSENFYSYGD